MTDGGESGALPKGWAGAPLGVIADCRLGKMLDQAKNRGDLRPYLRNTNVQWGSINLDDVKTMRIAEDERDRYRVLPGDLLVCEGGVPGRCAVWDDEREMYLQKALHRVRLRGGTSPDYLRWWLQNAAITGGLDHFLTGSTIKHLPGRQLARIEIGLPPVAEQHRIAERLDEISATTVAATAHASTASRAVDRFRSAVVAAACSGRLTSDWRDDAPPHETAEELAEAIAVARQAALGSRHRDPSAPDASWDVPEGWVWTTPQRLSHPRRSLTYGVIKLGAPSPDGVPTLRSSDVRWLRLATDGVKRIARAIADNYKRTYLQGGEVVVTVRGSLGGVAVVPDHMAGWNVSREVAVIPLVPEVHAPFVALAIASPQCQRWMAAAAKGVAYTGVNIEDLKRLPVPLPPLHEQVEIARRAEEMLSSADRLSTRIDHVANTLERASRAALAQAFRGRLVPTEAALAVDESREFESGEQLVARLNATSAPTATHRRVTKQTA